MELVFSSFSFSSSITQLYHCDYRQILLGMKYAVDTHTWVFIVIAVCLPHLNVAQLHIENLVNWKICKTNYSFSFFLVFVELAWPAGMFPSAVYLCIVSKLKYVVKCQKQFCFTSWSANKSTAMEWYNLWFHDDSVKKRLHSTLHMPKGRVSVHWNLYPSKKTSLFFLQLMHLDALYW